MADSRDIKNSSKDIQIPPLSNNHKPAPINRITVSRDSYWFAHGGVGDEDALLVNRNSKATAENKEAQIQKEREEKIRQFREQQEGERVKRMKDLEQSFVAAKKYREQQEEERKRRIEEARIREIERRQQVEERKRQIWEAEQERKEAILRRNLEREARIEARRNAQRNSACFAFGSSTPRTFDLDLAALGGGRNTALGCSLMSSVSTRLPADRECSVKRATSACSLDRKSDFFDCFQIHQGSVSEFGDQCSLMTNHSDQFNFSKPTTVGYMNSDQTKACLTMSDDDYCFTPTSFAKSASSSCLVGSGAVVGDDCMTWSVVSLSSGTRGRRRTDLTPITPRERSMTPGSASRAKDTSRSPSRPQSSMSVRSELSGTSSQASTVSLRPRPAPRKPRPVSIAVTGLHSNNSTQERTTKGLEQNPIAIPKPPRAKSTDFATLRKPVPPPKSAEVLAKARTHPVPTKDNLRKNVKLPNVQEKATVAVQKSAPATPQGDEGTIAKNLVAKVVPDKPTVPEKTTNVTEKSHVPEKTTFVQEEPNVPEKTPTVSEKPIVVEKTNAEPRDEVEREPSPVSEPKSESSSSESVPSISENSEAKRLIISEEEKAKAALAEKRRLAREQAEREAALEKQRQEELRLQEEERKKQEELEQKRLEEEQILLAQIHQKMEEEKLRKAIEEQKQREKEEQERKEEELRLKAEKEELDRKAREEAEVQRIKLVERIRKEELERAERKKRVDEIMSRTRAAKGGTPQTNGTQSQSVNSPLQTISNSLENANSVHTHVSKSSNVIITNNGLGDSEQTIKNDFESNAIRKSSDVKNGYHDDTVQSFLKTAGKNVVNSVPNKIYSDAVSPGQTNGYSSHEEMTSSPEERSEKSDSSEILIDFTSSNKTSSIIRNEQSDSNQLLSFVSADVVNSNLLSSTESCLVIEGSFQKQNENIIPDLLS